MASNKRRALDSGKSSYSFSESIRSNGSDGTVDGSRTGRSVEGQAELDGTDDILIQLKMYVDEPLCQICLEHEIQPHMAKYLPKLRDYEIVIVCDDSGSMKTPVRGPQKTRWGELCDIVKVIVKIGVVFDSNGVDIHFLNRDSLCNVKDPFVVEQAFATPPCGYTPLVPVLNGIFTSHLASPGRDKKLLVFVATDGEPTDRCNKPNIPELENLMRKRQVDTTYVSFLICTDDTEAVQYLRVWDEIMPNVDVTDDYYTERQNIRKCQKNSKYPFSNGDYIVKALVGAFVPELDKLNERKKRKNRIS